MSKNKLVGFVMCGGQSSRMGVDKSRIIYHQKEQRYHVYGLLQSLCDDVFLSINNSQLKDIYHEYQFLVDDKEYSNIGPLAGLLTAINHLPENDFLIVGCDYPLMTKQELVGFYKSIEDRNVAAAFYNKTDNMYEPLLAYYPAQSKSVLMEMFNNKQYSLQQYLRNSKAKKYTPINDENIKSVDEQITMMQIQSKLKSIE